MERHIKFSEALSATLPNFVGISQTLVQISRFFDFRDGGYCPSWTFRNSKFTLMFGSVQRVNMRQRATVG